MKTKRCVCLLTVFLTFSSWLGAKPGQGDKPNVIFVLANDMGHGDVGAFNKAAKIKTPKLDRMAAEGNIPTCA